MCWRQRSEDIICSPKRQGGGSLQSGDPLCLHLCSECEHAGSIFAESFLILARSELKNASAALQTVDNIIVYPRPQPFLLVVECKLQME